MKYIAAAVVVVALCAASFAGDLGWISGSDAHNWDYSATCGLVLFALLCMFGESK